MGRKGNLAIFESTNISETRGTMPTKFDVHAFDINPYLHDLLGQFRSIKFFDDHGLKGKFGCFENVPIPPKPEKLRPPNLMCMHLTSIPTCMIFWANSDRLNFLMTTDYSPWVEKEI